eukprot:Gregarina_sp_Poly_1__1563@NODE_1397_length_4220_cov_187_503491_g930_i0_p2_GENE_NODE_1397_length_4220_cov_187_503491_g930_i0NODE_1397_length_4220_cov_187_503491_g930_i0_p2_ORF_typecomplete_len255_score30_30_NODE_1397_length_4220_cov_187_503491_g930_i011891953
MPSESLLHSAALVKQLDAPGFIRNKRRPKNKQDQLPSFSIGTDVSPPRPSQDGSSIDEGESPGKRRQMDSPYVDPLALDSVTAPHAPLLTPDEVAWESDSDKSYPTVSELVWINDQKAAIIPSVSPEKTPAISVSREDKLHRLATTLKPASHPIGGLTPKNYSKIKQPERTGISTSQRKTADATPPDLVAHGQRATPTLQKTALELDLPESKDIFRNRRDKIKRLRIEISYCTAARQILLIPINRHLWRMYHYL